MILSDKCKIAKTLLAVYMTYFSKRVALILKNDSLREILQLVIRGADQYEVVAEDATYSKLDFIVQTGKPDVVIMDLQFDKMHNGIEAIRKIKNSSIQCHILILSECRRSDMIFAAFKAGASGYIIKQREIHKEILKWLDDLCNGGAPLSSEIARIVVESFHLVSRSELTRRESEVLQLLAEGKTYSEISEDLTISKETSKAHIKNIYAKLRVNTKHEAIAKGIEKKIVYHPHTKPLVILSSD
jgi:DNA-binding NarL/FixJ family response regulator